MSQLLISADGRLRDEEWAAEWQLEIKPLPDFIMCIFSGFIFRSCIFISNSSSKNRIKSQLKWYSGGLRTKKENSSMALLFAHFYWLCSSQPLSAVRFWCPSSHPSVSVVWEEWIDKQESSFSQDLEVGSFCSITDKGLCYINHPHYKTRLAALMTYSNSPFSVQRICYGHSRDALA